MSPTESPLVKVAPITSFDLILYFIKLVLVLTLPQPVSLNLSRVLCALSHDF